MNCTVALLCDPGCEPEAALEAHELTAKTARQAVGYVTLERCTAEQIATLCYRSQTASRIIALIAEGTITDPEELDKIKEELLLFDYAPFLKHGGSFKVECERIGEHNFQAHDIEMKLGELLFEEKKFPVSLKKPDMTLYCAVVDDSFVLGVDLAGRDLGKREYKAFHTRRGMRSSVAYAAVRAVGYTGKETLVDPLVMDGSLVIEAALFATKTSPQRFRKEFAFLTMPFAEGQKLDKIFGDHQGQPRPIGGYTNTIGSLKLVRANAKLAGILETLHLTKCELDWLDTKLEEKSVHFFVTAPPASGKNTPLKDLEKQHDDLFKQASRLLSKNGAMLLVVEKKAEFLNPAVRHGFSLSSERNVRMGEKPLFFLTFKRS